MSVQMFKKSGDGFEEKLVKPEESNSHVAVGWVFERPEPVAYEEEVAPGPEDTEEAKLTVPETKEEPITNLIPETEKLVVAKKVKRTRKKKTKVSEK